MNRDIEGLRNHLFAQLEKLGDEDLAGDQLKEEIERSKSMSQISGQLLDSAKVEFQYLQLTGREDSHVGFIERRESDSRRLK